MTNRLPPDPPLDIPFLAGFVANCRWMRKHGDWKHRLLYRLAKEHLDMLTQMAIAEGVVEEEKKWARKVSR